MEGRSLLWKMKTRYTILLGMTNKDDEEKKINCDRAVSLVGKVCKAYNVPFSVTIQKGGYNHNDGRFVLEDSLAVCIIGLKQKLVKEIANDLCCFLCQECVMITKEKVFIHSISDSITL